MGGKAAQGDVGTIERAVQLMKHMATAGRRGLPLTRLASDTGLPYSTVHRLLQRLIQQRMVVQNESNKRYLLGPLAFELGVAASMSFDLREPCRRYLLSLAEEVGDTVYLTVRSGADAVCLDRYEGPSPVRVLTLEVGSRRPLGLGAGGLAMLAFLPEEEREALIASLATDVPAKGGSRLEIDLHKAVARCRKDGYAFIRNQVNPGVSAVGVPLFDSLDQPIAAISVAAIDGRMGPARIQSLASILQTRARAIRKALNAAA
ncbi:IclR family transcriptional regulator [Parapusillimonas sp. JC17]|uniref:IclR family transcriptional regulator n=1 Tax=Parapusillimonas sp. JC17 TaxID=3445768 RepID=UPI003F9FF53E